MNNYMDNDLISRSKLKEKLTPIKLFGGAYCKAITEKDIDNAPTALFPLTVQIIDKVPDEDIETIKQLMKDYKPQILNLKTERPQVKFVEMLKDRIEESVCGYCQMNKHCELCEISRVFSIIDLTNEEMKDGAE